MDFATLPWVGTFQKIRDCRLLRYAVASLSGTHIILTNRQGFTLFLRCRAHVCRICGCGHTGPKHSFLDPLMPLAPYKWACILCGGSTPTDLAHFCGIIASTPLSMCIFVFLPLRSICRETPASHHSTYLDTKVVLR